MSIVTKITAVFSFLVLMISTLVGYISYNAGSRLLEETESARLNQALQTVEREFAIMFEGVSADVLFLSDIPALKYIAEYQADYPIQAPTPLTEAELLACSSGTFLGFMQNREFYSQTRFIGRANNGRELIRVERNKTGLQVVKAEDLQEKGTQDYFQATLPLEDNQLYLSSIHLNQEHGAIEIPYTPTVRAATPIHSSNQEHVGILIIDVEMQKLFHKIQQNLPQNMRLYIANQDGDYLLHPDESKIFSFDLGKRHLMQEEFPQTQILFENLQNEFLDISLSSITHPTEENFAYFARMQFSPDKLQNAILHVGILLPHNVATGKWTILMDSLNKALFLCALGILFTFYFAFLLTNPLKKITLAVSRFSKGEHQVDLCLNRTDEIGELARTCQMMANQIRWQLLRLEDEKHRLQTIFNTAAEAIVVINEQGSIESVNHSLEKLFGYKEYELLGKNINLLMPEAFHVDLKEEEQNTTTDIPVRLLNGGQELQGHHKNGQVLQLHVGISEFSIAHGRKFVGMVHDISLRKQAEQALLAERDRAEAANRAKSSFLANMSHEFRTPLNGILGYTQLLRRDAQLLPTQRESVNIIHRSGEHLLALINDILDLSKIEAERLEIVPIELDFRSFIKDLNYLFKARAAQKRVAFMCEETTPLPNGIYADGKRLRQVLLNLLGNAIKFTDQGRVNFQVGLHDGVLTFDIIDTGIGIPDADLESIFHPFHQVENHIQSLEGTGLGLAITRRLVEMMQGTVEVESQEGCGSHFHVAFCFPILNDTSQLQVQESRAVIGCAKDVRYRLLLVDDKPDNRLFLSNFLTSLGFIVEEAGNGKEALEILQQQAIDLVLLDLFMLVMDGFATAQAIRAQTEWQDLPIIAVSAGVFAQQQQQALAAGCDAFLEKPVNTEKLLHYLQKYLGLDWVYEADKTQFDDNGPRPPSNAALLYEYLPRLRECSRHGDIQGILDVLDELPEAEAQSEFFACTRQLVQDIDMQGLRRLLEQAQAEMRS